MLNFRYSRFKKSIFCLGMLMASSTSFAQGAGHSGGGNVTEGDLKHFMNKLSIFLQSEEGLNLFPEVKKYNDSHPQENFYEVIAKTSPVVVGEKLYDQNGVERDCMSYVLPGKRFFKCNKDALPPNELNHQPSLYRIVLHELFVQAGIEMPVDDDVRSAYAVSSRIMDNLHLATYQEWVPGRISGDDMIFGVGVKCLYETFAFRGSWKHPKREMVLFFPEGTVFYRREQSPRAFTDERRCRTRSGKCRWTGPYRFLSIFGEKTKILEQGESKVELDRWNTLEAFNVELKIGETRRRLKLLMPPIDNSTRSISETASEFKTGLLEEKVYSKRNPYQVIRTQQYQCQWVRLAKTVTDGMRASFFEN